MLKSTFILTLISVLLIGAFSPLLGPEILVFGPKQYTRNQGKPVTETDNFPSSITGPDFTLRVINGDEQGDHRVSSATVVLNGEQILSPSDFNQQVGVIERTVSINSNNEISVKLTSAPGSFITISIFKVYQEPTVSISASPLTIEFGESSTLTWTSTNADSATIDNGIGDVPVTGSVIVSPEIPTTTYTITVTGPGGTATSSTTVNVIFPEPTANISASPTNILLGESSTLTWSTSNAHTVTIDQGIGNVDLNGSIDVSPTETTTYTVTATF